MEEEEEQCDPESLANRLHDMEGDEKEDQRLKEANVQSTPLQADDRISPCNAAQRTERSNGEQKERLNVSWVQQLCDGKSHRPSNPVNTGEMKSVFPCSLP